MFYINRIFRAVECASLIMVGWEACTIYVMITMSMVGSLVEDSAFTRSTIEHLLILVASVCAFFLSNFIGRRTASSR